MAMNTFLSILLIYRYISGAFGEYTDPDNTFVDEIKAINAKFHSLEESCRSQIYDLRVESHKKESEFIRLFDDLARQVKNLEKKNDALELENVKIRTLLEGGQQLVGADDGAQQRAEDGVTDASKLTGKVSYSKYPKVYDMRPRVASSRHRRALVEGYNIAFSAYMDHDINGLGVNQTLIFNQILLNDGGSYNKHSGIFSAPMAGVYSFTFFIGQRDTHDLWVGLWQNSDNKIDAATETVHTTQDGQGGNSAILKLEKGDIVYVRDIGGSHVEGSRSLRLTSFSGFLLYPVEDVTILGK